MVLPFPCVDRNFNLFKLVIKKKGLNPALKIPIVKRIGKLDNLQELNFLQWYQSDLDNIDDLTDLIQEKPHFVLHIGGLQQVEQWVLPNNIQKIVIKNSPCLKNLDLKRAKNLKQLSLINTDTQVYNKSEATILYRLSLGNVNDASYLQSLLDATKPKHLSITSLTCDISQVHAPYLESISIHKENQVR